MGQQGAAIVVAAMLTCRYNLLAMRKLLNSNRKYITLSYLLQDFDEGIDLRNGSNQDDSENNRHQTGGNVPGPAGPYVYELFSIMIHSGSASGGHYYVYIKDFEKEKWFCFDDQSVTSVSILCH